MSLAGFLKVWASEFGFLPEREVPLAPYTSIGVGGPAEMVFKAEDVDSLVKAIQLALEHGIPYTLLGGGSNVLVPDEGIGGLVILNRCKGWHMNGGDIYAEAGMPFAGLARGAIQAGLAGLEWGVSIPGTVGGAVVGNAGAYGGDTASVLKSADLLTPDGHRETWPVAKLEYGYRTSRIKEALARGDRWVVLTATFHGKQSNRDELCRLADGYLNHRRETQPKEPSIGSTFRNPPGDYAGRLLDAAGMKGYRIGGAQVSTRHANFIVNLGDATASDVLALMEEMQHRVQEMFGVALEPEILVLNQRISESADGQIKSGVGR